MGKAVRAVLRMLRLGLGLAGLGLFTGLVLVVREYHRDPLPLLDRGDEQLCVSRKYAKHFLTLSGEPREGWDLELLGDAEGPLRASVSLPEGEAGPFPVVVILGGLEVGRQSLQYVGTHGRNALVACEYPRTSDYWYEGAPLKKLPQIRAAALSVPARTSALLAWIRTQSWADKDRVSLLGYSFGADFVPAAARVAEGRGQAPSHLVMAYGGADLPGLFDANVTLRPRALQWAVGRILAAVVRPLEPALHLPYLRGEALFITGLRDHKVPLANARLMQFLKPEPKTVLDLDAGHMDPGNPKLTAEIVGRSREWLIARNAMNP